MCGADNVVCGGCRWWMPESASASEPGFSVSYLSHRVSRRRSTPAVHTHVSQQSSRRPSQCRAPLRRRPRAKRRWRAHGCPALVVSEGGIEASSKHSGRVRAPDHGRARALGRNLEAGSENLGANSDCRRQLHSCKRQFARAAHRSRAVGRRWRPGPATAPPSVSRSPRAYRHMSPDKLMCGTP